MANDYFSAYSPLPRNQLARAEAVNTIFDAIVVGFDTLPAIAPLKQDRVAYAADTGSVNAYAVSLDASIVALTAGLRVTMKVGTKSTGPSTLNVNSIGSVGIKRFDGSDVEADDVQGIAVMVYDGTNFVLVSQHASEAAETAASAAAAASSASAASSSASSASSSASDAAASAASAASSATSASGSATSATASATSATNSKNAAATSATNAATSETNAANSATAAAGSATTATTQAGNASASATAAATSATTATTQAGNASTSAGTASAQATNASASAASAAASASAALANVQAARFVAVVATTNVALATGLAAGQSVDGVTVATGDRILLTAQSTASQNGVYTAPASGTASRATDSDTAAEIQCGALMIVQKGTTYAKTEWQHTTAPGFTLGSTSLTFIQMDAKAQTLSNKTLAAPVVTGLLDISAASAGQIKFPATQNAAADANTLDDYEEGTWTPKVTGSTSGEATYTVQSGYYRKIGDWVFAYFSITTSGVAALVGTRAEVSNFPFACSSVANDNGTGVLGNYNGLTLPAGTQVGGLMVANATSMRIQYSGSTISGSALAPSALASTTVLSGFCAYHI